MNSRTYCKDCEARISLFRPHEAPEMDAQITFSIPVANTYLFDAETEMVIR